VQVLPVTLVSLLAFIPLFLVPGRESGQFIEKDILVSGEEYLAHAAFQAGFSFRSLSGGDSGYFRYTLGEDGIMGPGRSVSPEADPVPPFPLADLMDFLGGSGPRPGPSLPEIISPLLLFLCSVPVLFLPRRGGKKGKSIVLYKRVGPFIVRGSAPRSAGPSYRYIQPARKDA
jgi:hypothetical protein